MTASSYDKDGSTKMTNGLGMTATATDFKQKPKTQRGVRMAASIGEFILMRYFFPEVRDRKKLARHHDDFHRDMNFSLKTG